MPTDADDIRALAAALGLHDLNQEELESFERMRASIRETLSRLPRWVEDEPAWTLTVPLSPTSKSGL